MELSELFDEFVEEYNNGKDPQIEDYLRRCNSNKKEFQNLIDVFLMARHNLPSDIKNKSWQSFSASFFAGEVASLKQLESMTFGDALISFSRQREMSRGNIVKGLMNRLNLDTQNQMKVERFHWQYHRLENNFIEPQRVSYRLLEAIAEVFQMPVSYFEGAQQRSKYVEVEQPLEMKIAARVAEEGGKYRERSRQVQAEEQFEEIDQLFNEVKDNAK